MYDMYHTYSILMYVYSILAYVNKQQNTFVDFFHLTVLSSVCLNGVLPEPVNIGLNIGQGSGHGPTLYMLMESVCKQKLQTNSNTFLSVPLL